MTNVVALLDGIGNGELLVIGVLALLMFGSKRLPELGRGLGRAIREFKKATSGVEENLREVLREEPTTPKIRPPQWQGPPRENVMDPHAHPLPEQTTLALETPTEQPAIEPTVEAQFDATHHAEHTTPATPPPAAHESAPLTPPHHDSSSGSSNPSS